MNEILNKHIRAIDKIESSARAASVDVDETIAAVNLMMRQLRDKLNIYDGYRLMKQTAINNMAAELKGASR